MSSLQNDRLIFSTLFSAVRVSASSHYFASSQFTSIRQGRGYDVTARLWSAVKNRQKYSRLDCVIVSLNILCRIIQLARGLSTANDIGCRQRVCRRLRDHRRCVGPVAEISANLFFIAAVASNVSDNAVVSIYRRASSLLRRSLRSHTLSLLLLVRRRLSYRPSYGFFSGRIPRYAWHTPLSSKCAARRWGQTSAAQVPHPTPVVRGTAKMVGYR